MERTLYAELIRVPQDLPQSRDIEVAAHSLVDHRRGGNLQVYRLRRRRDPGIETVLAIFPGEDLEQLHPQLEVEGIDEVVGTDAAHLDQDRPLSSTGCFHPPGRFLAFGFGDDPLP